MDQSIKQNAFDRAMISRGGRVERSVFDSTTSSDQQDSISHLASPSDWSYPLYVDQSPPTIDRSTTRDQSIHQNTIYTSAEIGYNNPPIDQPGEIRSWPCCHRSVSVTSAGSDPSDYSIKRARNNKAVKKSRAKTKALREELEAKCEEQKYENDRLKERLNELTKDLDFEKRKSLHLFETMTTMSRRNAQQQQQQLNSTNDKNKCKHCCSNGC